ncbi:MAG: hypothetical protein ACRBBR_17050 [Cellvibrionaceae bacterium]
MKDLEQSIEHHMRYCRHFRTPLQFNTCQAGIEYKTVRFQIAGKRVASAPCIDGHKLDSPGNRCPKWSRPTRAEAEQEARLSKESLDRMVMALKATSEWRKKPPIGKAETVKCPACNGRLHLNQAASNGHVSGICETDGCLNWME